MPRFVTVASEAHAKALEDRDRFLEEHPELRSLQERIDQRLAHAESEHNRLVMMQDLMMDSFIKLDGTLKAFARARKAAKKRSQERAARTRGSAPGKP